MDLVQTLLATLIGITVALVISVQSFLGGLLSEEKIVILPPNESHSSAATTSSQAVIGTSTTTTQPKKETTKTTPTVSATPVKPSAPAPVVQPPNLDPELLNSQTRAALVNILCTTQGGGVHPISGSGVFVDSRGVILTNAHIGQYFLLKDYPSIDNVDCTIRIGNPAQPRYRATLLYLPPTWIANNATQIKAEVAKGTGEHDYAFLLVTGPTGPTPLPAQFPNLPMASDEMDIGVSTLLAAYPAGFLDGINIQKNLFVSTAYAVVRELFTFGEGLEVDLISIGGTVVSQGGSSGGAVVRATDGKLVGLIATATTANTTAARDLRAITVAHINRSLAAHGEGGIAMLLSQDVSVAAARFASSTAPIERATLIKVFEGN